MIFSDSFDTPLGTMTVSASATAVTSIHFVDQADTANPNPMTALTIQQLNEYFANARTAFDLPLDADGTSFQKQVWLALESIDYGKTCSYSDIAAQIGNPKAVRAVGLANGKNPLTIVVPCHRVIGVNGKLTGYAGGVDRKAWLLKHEGCLLF